MRNDKARRILRDLVVETYLGDELEEITPGELGEALLMYDSLLVARTRTLRENRGVDNG